MKPISQRPVRALLRLATWILLLLLLAAIVPGLSAAGPEAKSVSLVVDYGDGAQAHFTALPWRDGMTVVDALSAAQKHPHGITFVQGGSGSTALITQIGDLKNQGSGKNWLYSVNDKTAEVGAGAYELQSGDRVLWEFKEYE